jgi:hypothetical protein
VTSGHRVVLTYNLLHIGNSVPPPLRSDGEQSSALGRCLKAWSTSFDVGVDVDDALAEDVPESMPNLLVYLLDHEYTQANLKLDNLKGDDHRRVNALARIAGRSGFHCYLGTIEKTVKGGVSGDDSDYNSWEMHDIDDVTEERISVSQVFELDGTLYAEEVDIEEDDFVQAEPFEDRKPDDEDYEGWTGNEGAETTHFYRDTVGTIDKRRLIFPLIGVGFDHHARRLHPSFPSPQRWMSHASTQDD